MLCRASEMGGKRKHTGALVQTEFVSRKRPDPFIFALPQAGAVFVFVLQKDGLKWRGSEEWRDKDSVHKF